MVKTQSPNRVNHTDDKMIRKKVAESAIRLVGSFLFVLNKNQVLFKVLKLGILRVCLYLCQCVPV